MPYTTDQVIPAIGDQLQPSKGIWGVVVDVLISGEKVVLARPSPAKRGDILETVHDTKDCKGLMTGRLVVPVTR